MANQSGKAFLEDSERDYHAKRERIESVTLPLKNASGEPWRIFFRLAVPLRDSKKIEAAREKGGLIDMAVETVILRALDENGELMFDKGDRFALMNKIDAEVALAIVSEIGGYRAEDLEQAEKN